jgi:hypothetical protein
MDCRKKFGGRNVPAKSAINHCARKMEKTYSLLGEHRRRCWLMSEAMILDMWARLQCSPRWCLCWFLHESGYSYSTSQRSANKAEPPPFRVTVIYKLPMFSKFLSKFQGNTLCNMIYVWNLSGYTNSQNYKTWAAKNPYVIGEEPLHLERV